MNQDKPTLQQIAQKASDRNGGKRGRGLGRIAESHGLTLSYGTVDRILSGKYNSRPTKQTLEGLALLAGVPIEEVYEAAGEPIPFAPLVDQLPPDVDLLTAEQRRVVIDLARVFINQNRAYMALENEQKQAHDDHSQSEPTPADDPELQPDAEGALSSQKSDFDLAAYEPGGKSMKRRQTDKQDHDAEGSQDPGDIY